MLGIFLVVFSLGNIVCFTQGANKPRCAVVLFVNERSSNTDEDSAEYLKNLQGLSLNKTNVYFSDDPDTFKVKHGDFIDAPGLFALESEKYPGMFLREANHTIVLEHENTSESFKNDATFLMDHSDKNESFTTFKLFSHRSWKLFSRPDSKGPLLFDTPKDSVDHKTNFSLLVIAQPCMRNDSTPTKVVTPSERKADVIKDDDDDSASLRSADKALLEVSSLLSDPTLDRQTDAKYVTALTNKGKVNSISNEYAFENFEVPDFIMHSLVEENKNAGDGMEVPKVDIKPSASLLHNDYHEKQQMIEHQTKVPIAKQKISELSSLMVEKDMGDIETTLKDLQYGAKGCKLLVAEDTDEEDGTSKDTVARPGQKIKKACIDEFPPSCEEMAKKGYCLAFKSLMSTVCRKSCNLCSSLMDTGFTSCTKSCGSGRQIRMIKINHREYLQTRRCNTKPCPIDGGYSEFGNFTECGVTCGQGIRYRRRTCTRPRPQFNGSSCRKLGPSIESDDCYAGACPVLLKNHDHLDHYAKKGNHKQTTDTVHRKTNLHIDGKHTDEVHEHSILLKGKKVAKLRCTPRQGMLRSIIQDAITKRFIVHQSKKKNTSKKSDIDDGKDDPVDASNPVVRAFKSPYKILLARKGPHNSKIVEECVEAAEDETAENETDEDETMSDDGQDFEGREEISDENTTKSKKKQHKTDKHKNRHVYTRPGEKSYKDFDEYKYETGNVVIPQAMSSTDDESDYSAPSEKLFDETRGLNSVLNKVNAVNPKIGDQLSNERYLESAFKIENENSVNGLPFNNEGAAQEGDQDSASRAGFSVTTAPDSNPMQSGGNNGMDSDGYDVESLADG